MKIGIYIKNDAYRTDPRLETLLRRLEEARMTVYQIRSRDDVRPGTGLVLAVGGDGTFLSASKRVAGTGIPLLGVNLGRLGFLSENDPESVAQALVEGAYAVEDRSMLAASVTGEGFVPPDGFWPYALNEITVHRRGAAVLGIRISVDGDVLPTYWADGLLVATSSGSTAYSLSVGGPICSPDARVLIIAPIAPHNLNVRPLVVPDTARIGIDVTSRDPGAVVTMDNRTLDFDPAWHLEVCMAQFSLKRIRLARSNFVKALTSKLFWGEDIRNNGE